MKGIKRFIELHHRSIGNLANFLGIGSAVMALAGWLGERPPWLWPAVAAVALVALALAAVRINQLGKSALEKDEAFDDLLRITNGLFMADLRDKVAGMERNNAIPITEMAAFFQTLRHVRQECGASPDGLRGIDDALAQLAEYERQVTGRGGHP